MSEADRLRWRCRRGMRELDVLLERWLAQAETAPAAERRVFERLLDQPDPLLWDWLVAGRPCADPELDRLCRRIRTSI